MRSTIYTPLPDEDTLDKTITLRERYLELLEAMADLHKRKNAGYAGESPDPWANFRMSEKFNVPALIGVMVRLTDKWIRADNLNGNASLDRVGQSIKDALMDFAAYSLIAVCLWRETKHGVPLRGNKAGLGDPEYLSLLGELQVYQPPRPRIGGEARRPGGRVRPRVRPRQRSAAQGTGVPGDMSDANEIQGRRPVGEGGGGLPAPRPSAKIQALRASLAIMDRVGIRRLAHTLKSSSANVGALGLCIERAKSVRR